MGNPLISNIKRI
ncbi:hypothetical protein F383_30812 [Gossypium arboreum]|nr:hypothetical protein F383_30812 [Gossypium arboreum]